MSNMVTAILKKVCENSHFAIVIISEIAQGNQKEEKFSKTKDQKGPRPETQTLRQEHMVCWQPQTNSAQSTNSQRP